jgi:hypothetical protein
VDNTFSDADTMLFSNLYIAELLGVLKEFPKLEKYFNNLAKRPSNKKAMENKITSN